MRKHVPPQGRSTTLVGNRYQPYLPTPKHAGQEICPAFPPDNKNAGLGVEGLYRGPAGGRVDTCQDPTHQRFRCQALGTLSPAWELLRDILMASWVVVT